MGMKDYLGLPTMASTALKRDGRGMEMQERCNIDSGYCAGEGMGMHGGCSMGGGYRAEGGMGVRGYVASVVISGQKEV